MRILVTGASGFVGRNVVAHLRRRGIETVAAFRPSGTPAQGAGTVVYEPGENDGEVLRGIDGVVHAAGVAHRSERPAAGGPDEFELGNHGLTRRLCAAVEESEVSLFVHIGSIAAAGFVGGERAAPITEEDGIPPAGAYGRSKLRAEAPVIALKGVGKVGINLRPPLIYGPGAGGNWARLAKLAALPLPLPFGLVEARRSYLGIGNLCDLLFHLCAFRHRPELGGTYHVADESPVSLREVVSAVRRGGGRRPCLLPCPVPWMEAGLGLLGRERMASGLFGELVVDGSRLQEAFSWSPPLGTLEGMERSVAGEGDDG